MRRWPILIYEEQIFYEKNKTYFERTPKYEGTTKKDRYSVTNRNGHVIEYEEIRIKYRFNYEKEILKSILIVATNKDGTEKKLSEYKINYSEDRIESYDLYDYIDNEPEFNYHTEFENYDSYGNWHKEIRQINGREIVWEREIEYW